MVVGEGMLRQGNARVICNHACPVSVPSHQRQKAARISPGRAKHVPSSCLGCSMTTQGDNETAINGRINTAQQAVRLAGATDSCRAMGLPNPGSPQSHGSLQSKRPAAPGPGIAPIMIRTKTGSPQTMVSPESVLPPNQFRTSHGSAGSQDPGEGRPAGRLRQSSPWVGPDRPTVNCSFTDVLALAAGSWQGRRATHAPAQQADR